MHFAGTQYQVDLGVCRQIAATWKAVAPASLNFAKPRPPVVKPPAGTQFIAARASSDLGWLISCCLEVVPGFCW